MNLGDKCAFPIHVEGYPPEPGMTLREHYAGLAMQGLLAAGAIAHGWEDYHYTIGATAAVRSADALIEALEVKL